MNTDGDGWSGRASATDAVLIDKAPGGELTQGARQAAIEASLGLLGVYFASGDHDVAEHAAISRAYSDQSNELEVMRNGLRLRVALAAARRLTKILGSINRRPTFRYELVPDEQAGALAGTLDINRWITSQRGSDEVVSFPVLEVKRGACTSENILASYAALWIMRELTTSLKASLATKESVEYQVVRARREALERQLRSPVFMSCLRDAQSVRTKSRLVRLIEDGRRRIRRREISHPDSYRALIEWISDCLNGIPAVSPGAVDLSVYGSRFDSKLFELWCLEALSKNLALTLNLPDPTIDAAWRTSAPAYRFATFIGRIDLYFQRGFSGIAGGRLPKWRKKSGRGLGGVPDIIVHTKSAGGHERFGIIDPKLRQRDRVPAEELYKVLGYINNFEVSPAIGVVLLYTTGKSVVDPDVFEDSDGGVLISASLNPEASESVVRSSLAEVITTILLLIGFEADVRPAEEEGAVGAPNASEAAITHLQRNIVKWGDQNSGEIAPSRERIRTLLGDERWRVLSPDVQTMVATADLIGYRLEDSADFSGPVIGICSAIEYLLFESIVSPVVTAKVDLQRQVRTFGAAIEAIDMACRGKGGELSASVRRFIDERGIEANSLAELIPMWRRLNTQFRVPAAHRQIVSKVDWNRLYRLVMGADAVFVRTYDAIRGSSESQDADSVLP